jgi:hypothetical protein
MNYPMTAPSVCLLLLLSACSPSGENDSNTAQPGNSIPVDAMSENQAITVVM